MAESDKPDNVYEGLHTSPVELHTDVDPRKIGPNGDRPMEVGTTAFVLGPNNPT